MLSVSHKWAPELFRASVAINISRLTALPPFSFNSCRQDSRRAGFRSVGF